MEKSAQHLPKCCKYASSPEIRWNCDEVCKRCPKSLKIHKIRSDVISDNLVELENIDFDKEEKVTSVALDEFLDGDIDWNKTEESIEQ